MRIGILGGGQLGRMLATAAQDLELEPLVLEPKPACPASRIAQTLCADYTDDAGLRALGRCDVVTYEFENVPPEALRRLAGRVRVDPTPEALLVMGDRLREKQLFMGLGIPTARFHAVDGAAAVASAAAAIGGPAILKSRRFGYDGKGQAALSGADEAARAWHQVGSVPSILEERVDFDREVSLIAVRGRDGEIRFWAPTENRHLDGILRVSRAPADGLDPAAVARARERVAGLLEHLDYVGVLAVEFFVRGDEWLANEAACRVHNSGHWTLGGAVTSQFENHVRAVAGLPLGETRPVEPSAMVNLIGELPATPALLSVPGARLHLYGKPPAPGRKLGHVTVTAPTREEVDARVDELLARVPGPRQARGSAA